MKKATGTSAILYVVYNKNVRTISQSYNILKLNFFCNCR